MIRALREHWPEASMEALGLGLFMVSAGLFGTLLEAPASPVRAAIASPDVRRALAWLAARGEARMTGTGSCVFAAFADRGAAAAALEGLPPEWRGFVARGLDRSPLQERLAAERSRGSGRV